MPRLKEEEEKELLLQKRLLEAQIEASNDGILVTSADRQILSFNQRLLELWNVSEAVRIGQSLDDVLRLIADRAEDPAACRATIEDLASKRDGKALGTMKLKGNRTIDLYSAPLRCADGGCHGRVTFFHDATRRIRTLDALHESEERLRILTNATSEGMAAYENGSVIIANPAFASMFGYDLPEVIGRPVREFLAPEFHDRLAFDTSPEAVTPSEVVGLKKDGTRLSIEVTGRTIPCRGRNVRVIAVRDITVHKRDQDDLERLSHRHALILNSAGDGIIGMDQSGKVTFANPGAARMTGFKVEQLVGRRFHDLVHHTRADDAPYPFEECPLMRVLELGSPRWVTGEVFWRKDGSSFPVECVSAPIPEGEEIVGAVLTFKDISERRMIERMKDEFVSVVSHELRTPLTSIRGSLGLLAGGLMGPLPVRAQHMLDIAVKNTDRLVNLINDILDIERIESGKVTLQKVDCDAADLISQAAEVVQAMADKAEVNLSVAPFSAPLFADPGRVVQVLANLLSNAIKFSYSGGTVWLDADRRGDEVLFRVRDEGRGIPPDKLEKIFERFQQVDASDSREKGGTGLGLAICRSIVHHHGGRVWAESGEKPIGAGRGPGSTFFFTLPAVHDERQVVVSAPADDTPVLVCDDDASVRTVVQALLEQKGYRVIAAGSGKEAIELAATERPRVILLDLLMPHMDGWETMDRLKERPETTEIPIVILSVLGPEESPETGLPISDWLTKPLDENSLFRALERAIGESARTPRVLVVEDDQDLTHVLTTMFERHGVETFNAQTGRDAIQLSQQVVPDLLVLDLALPEGDGFAVVDWLRQHNHLRNVSLVVYSARDLTEADRTRLKLEKTEYVTKGRISPEEFETLVIALVNRIVPRRK